MRRSAKVHPLAASGPPNCPWTSALSHFQYVPRRVFAFNPDCVLPDLNRRPIAYQAIALSTELNPLAGPIPACAPQSLRRLLGDEIQHAVCRSPTGYLTEHRDAGCPPEPRYSAQPHSLVRLVLTCATRCPSRLTMSVSRVAPPRVLSRACIPGSVPVHEPRWFRASLCRYLRRICQRRQEGRACLGRPNPKVRRDAMGRVPFPPLPAVIGARPLVLLTVFNIHVRRGRRSRAPPVLPLRLPRPMRSTAPALNTIHVVRERFTGAKKTPEVLRTDQGFSPVWKVRPASLPDPLSSKAYLMRWPRLNSCESAPTRSACDHCAQGSASPVSFTAGFPDGEPQPAKIAGCVAFQFMGCAVYRRTFRCQHFIGTLGS